MVSAVCFDLDGTLIDSTDAIVASFFHTFDVFGLPHPPRDRIVDTIGHVLEDQFQLFTDRDPHECTEVYRAHYGETCCERTTLLPGARELLERLQAAGLRLGFATSKRRCYAEQVLAHLEVLDYFSSRLGPDDVTQPKPDPEALFLAAEQLGVRPAEMVFVGDTHFDVLASRAAGVRCVCVTTGYATREALEALDPEAVYDTLAEVGDHILGDRVACV